VLKTESKRLEQALRDHLEQHPPLTRDQERLRTIPGVGERREDLAAEAGSLPSHGVRPRTPGRRVRRGGASASPVRDQPQPQAVHR
jgi:hypothetical protein